MAKIARRPWSEAEQRFVEQNAEKMSAGEIGRHLNRSPESVRDARRRFGTACPNQKDLERPRPLLLNDGTALIPLGGKHGKRFTALVDAADCEDLARWAWFADKLGYAKRGFRVEGKNVVVLMHRYLLNAPEGVEVDHLNNMPWDNRRSNLRLCNRTQNCANRRVARGGTSKYSGVSYQADMDKWRAYVDSGRTRYNLGFYESEDEAAHLRDCAALYLHGEFAYLNFPTVAVPMAPEDIRRRYDAR